MSVMTREFAKRMELSWFTPEARERLKKHLLSVGYTEDQLKPIEWPDDAVSAHREDCRDPWQFVTKGDIRRRRRKEAKDQLTMIREDGLVERRAMRLVVYYFPGYFTFGAFQGWYTALHGVNDFEYFSNWKYRFDKEIINQIMKMFPLVERGLWCDKDTFESWMKKFVKEHPIRVRRKDMVKIIGSAPVWVEVKGSKVIKILEVGQWPARKAV